MKNIILMFIGAGGIATIAFFISQLFDKKSGIRNAIHNIKQSDIIDNIKNIGKEQNTIKIKIDKYDKMSEASKKKIDAIKKEAEQKIQVVKQNENNLVETQKTIDNLWDDI